MYVCMYVCREINFEVVNLGKLQEYITLGKLVPPPDRMLTMRDLLESGVVSRVREGIKLLADVCIRINAHIGKYSL